MEKTKNVPNHQQPMNIIRITVQKQQNYAFHPPKWKSNEEWTSKLGLKSAFWDTRFVFYPYPCHTYPCQAGMTTSFCAFSGWTCSQKAEFMSVPRVTFEPPNMLTYIAFKWPCVVSFLIEKLWFSIAMLNYQRVPLSENGIPQRIPSSRSSWNIIMFHMKRAITCWGYTQCSQSITKSYSIQII